MVRALAFHKCGGVQFLQSASYRRHIVISALILLVFYSALTGFSPGTPVFPSHLKPTFDLTWFDLWNNNNNCKIVIWAMLIWFPLELWSAFDHIHMLICIIEILNIINIIIIVKVMLLKTLTNDLLTVLWLSANRSPTESWQSVNTLLPTDHCLSVGMLANLLTHSLHTAFIRQSTRGSSVYFYEEIHSVHTGRKKMKNEIINCIILLCLLKFLPSWVN